MKFQDGIKIMKTQKEKNTKKKRKSSKEVIPSGAWAVIRETALKFNILLVAHLRPSSLYFTQIWLWPICQKKNIVFYWEPRLKTLTSSETNPGWDRAVNRTNISNIRGNECVNCTARTLYEKGHFSLLIDSSIQGDCDFNGNMPNAAVPNEDNQRGLSQISMYFKPRCNDSLSNPWPSSC